VCDQGGDVAKRSRNVVISGVKKYRDPDPDAGRFKINKRFRIPNKRVLEL